MGKKTTTATPKQVDRKTKNREANLDRMADNMVKCSELGLDRRGEKPSKVLRRYDRMKSGITKDERSV